MSPLALGVDIEQNNCPYWWTVLSDLDLSVPPWQPGLLCVLSLAYSLQISCMPMDGVSSYSLNLLWMSSLLASSWIPVTKRIQPFAELLQVHHYPTPHCPHPLESCVGVPLKSWSLHLPFLCLFSPFVDVWLPALPTARSYSWPREEGVCHRSFLGSSCLSIKFIFNRHRNIDLYMIKWSMWHLNTYSLYGV